MGAAFRIGSVVLNVRDVPLEMAFWAAALDYQPRSEPEPDWVILSPRDGVGPNLSLNLGDTRPLLHPHVHLDLYAHDQKAEIERLVALGARRVRDWQYPDEERDFEVLEDPEGNRFCVIDASPDPSPDASPDASTDPSPDASPDANPAPTGD